MSGPLYIDASAGDLQRAFEIADDDLPDAFVLDGRWAAAGHVTDVERTWPSARRVEERILVVEVAGRRVWLASVFGAAQAVTYAHLGLRLGARAVVQIGSFGGLADGWAVGDVFVPSSVVGRDGVSHQLTQGAAITPDPSLGDRLRRALAAAAMEVRSGVLVTTTSISLERHADVARWRRAGYGGVDMESAATLAMAAHLGVPAAAALYLIDNLADDHTVFDQTDDERMRCRFARDAILRAAVASVIQSVS